MNTKKHESLKAHKAKLRLRQIGSANGTASAQPIDNSCAAFADGDCLLTSGQVKAQIGNVSDMCLWRWQRDPRVTFPAPDMMINGRRYWRRATIAAWSATRSR